MQALSPSPDRIIPASPLSFPRVISVGRDVPEGRFPVYARFARYLDILAGDTIIGITTMLEGEGPSTIVVSAHLPDSWTVLADSVLITPDMIEFCGVRFSRDTAAACREQPLLHPLAPPEHKRLTALITDCIDLVCHLAADTSMAVVFDRSRKRFFSGGFDTAMLARFMDGARACLKRDYPSAVRLLAGSGYGLTPSGDDFLCGSMLALHFLATVHPGSCAPAALALPLQDGLDACGKFSRTFVRHAIANRWPAVMRNTAETLCSLARRGSPADRATVEMRIRRILSHGSTSGSDLASGFFMTAAQYLNIVSVESWHKETNNGA